MQLLPGTESISECQDRASSLRMPRPGIGTYLDRRGYSWVVEPLDTSHRVVGATLDA
jgi:hypothetical protein